MRDVNLLVFAKAPRPGRVKTRLGATVGLEAAADVAAAALLDTIAACVDAARPERCHLALAGRLDGAVAGEELRHASAGWTITPQRGRGLGERLAHAHSRVGGPVVQVGMDTPQLTAALLRDVAAGLDEHDAVLGPATDGGWWTLGLRDPRRAAVLVGVDMSRPTTYADTRRALLDVGLTVGSVATLRDVDEEADADAVADAVPGTRFAAAWTAVPRVTAVPVAATAVLARAFRGEPCRVVAGRRSEPLPVADWLREPDADDVAIAGHCAGPTLDIGCGPGRLAALLVRGGHTVLGIDVVPEAVRQTVGRGAVALRRDVHGHVPGEGRWQSALLADGNVGIGGDPVALLQRVRALLTPQGGRVVAEVAGPGVPHRTRLLRLDCDGIRSEPFRWSVVGCDDLPAIAAAAGLSVMSLHPHGARWCAVLRTAS